MMKYFNDQNEMQMRQRLKVGLEFFFELVVFHLLFGDLSDGEKMPIRVVFYLGIYGVHEERS